MRNPIETSLMNEDKKASDLLFGIIVGTAVLLGIVYIGRFLIWKTGLPILAEIPTFVPVIHGFLVLETFTIAFLALGRHRALRDPVSYWIGIAFASFSILNIFYVLAWPGLRADGQSLIGHLPGTAAWMITLGQIIFSVFMIISVTVHWPGTQDLGGRRRFWSVIGWLILFTAIYILLVAFEEDLPAMISPKGTFTPLLLALSGTCAILYTAGAVLLTQYYRKVHDLLAGYAALDLVCLFFGLIGVATAGERYTAIWYLARLLAAAGGVAVLFGLLWEYIRPYRMEQDKTRALVESIAQSTKAGTELQISRRFLEIANKYTDLNQLL